MARVVLTLIIACCMSSVAAACDSKNTESLEQLVQILLCEIGALSDYDSAHVTAPPVTLLPQYELEAKVCDEPCNVTAAYVPREGVFLSGNLDPLRVLTDRAALLHELVHHVQQGHAKFAPLRGCRREFAKEEEAYALQNAYLQRQGSAERVAFYAGEFGCRPGGEL